MKTQNRSFGRRFGAPTLFIALAGIVASSSVRANDVYSTWDEASMYTNQYSVDFISTMPTKDFQADINKAIQDYFHGAVTPAYLRSIAWNLAQIKAQNPATDKVITTPQLANVAAYSNSAVNTNNSGYNQNSTGNVLAFYSAFRDVLSPLPANLKTPRDLLLMQMSVASNNTLVPPGLATVTDLDNYQAVLDLVWTLGQDPAYRAGPGKQIAQNMAANAVREIQGASNSTTTLSYASGAALTLEAFGYSDPTTTAAYVSALSLLGLDAVSTAPIRRYLYRIGALNVNSAAEAATDAFDFGYFWDAGNTDRKPVDLAFTRLAPTVREADLFAAMNSTVVPAEYTNSNDSFKDAAATAAMKAYGEAYVAPRIVSPAESGLAAQVFGAKSYEEAAETAFLSIRARLDSGTLQAGSLGHLIAPLNSYLAEMSDMTFTNLYKSAQQTVAQIQAATAPSAAAPAAAK